ncbi:MAG: gamma-glutamyltransferase [Armatimonadetes bacterium]|nr:gamma-glutamyltransferase [Armatimonadota bacterium]
MPAPHQIHAPAYRPAPLGTRGMVCSSHYLASAAGIRLLQSGGNAVDAAIGTAAVLGLVEPHMSGPAGDGFLMVHDGATGRIRCVNGTGPAPSRATRELFAAGGIPAKGIRSVSVPGLVGAWLLAHREWGTLSLEEVFEPACEIAREGFPLSHKVAASLAGEAAAGSPIATDPASAAVFAPRGRPLRAGELCRNPDYAATLELLIRDGADGFYRGRFGEALLELSRKQDGLFEPRDLHDFRAFFQEPIATTYRGHTVFEFPPNSSGHVLLQELNLVELFDLPTLGWLTPEAIHVMVEAKKLAFADREAYLADPDWVKIPLAGLLSKEYAAERARLIDRNRAATDVRAGRPGAEETTCFCVADGEGNAVSQLQSIQQAWGSGVIAPGTGLLLNNRMTYWHLDPGHPDELKPGKRVRHTMNPYMVQQEGELVLVGGTPGADTQVQTNLQVISHVLDFGLNVQEAVEAPRWRHTQNGTESDFPHTCADELILEARFSDEVRAGLAAKGHALRLIGEWEATGSQQMISRNPETGVLAGGSDPRRDSLALAW